NTGQQDWPNKVKAIYDHLIEDLGLNANEVPLLAGQVVSESAGGICAGHNAIIARLPNVIPNSYVISSEGCPARQDDHLHFTAEGYSGSANLPMYAQGDGNTFAFHYLTAGYKFTITDLDESVSKIKFVVENNTTYELSSDIKLVIDGNNIYLKHDWGDPGAERSLTYICKVNSKTATVYVPWRYNKSEGFQPTVTIYNADNDSKLKVISATNAAPGISEKGQVQPIRISCPGTGEEWEFESAYGISWNSITTSVAGDTGTGYDGIKTMKATADADNLYVYLEVKKDALYDDAGYQYSNQSQLYIGDGSGKTAFWAWPTPYIDRFESWMKYKNAPRYINWNAGFVGQKAMEHGDCYYYEIAIARSSYSALSGSSCTLCFYINKKYVYKDEAGAEVWAGEDTQIGFAPARWTEGLTVTLP
ncbi:MAG: hypothetical protein II542_00380, partial [Bacteroidales bacterium]|nr:hypothetical protein [Bacteroidales bacterium]